MINDTPQNHPDVWSRRRVLALAGTGFAGTAWLAARPLDPLTAAAATGFEALRDRFRALHLGPPFDATAEPFKSALATMITTASGYADTFAPRPGALWPDLDYADPKPDTDPESFGYSARVTSSYTRLLTLAEAYVRSGTTMSGDAAVLGKIIAGLDQLDAEVYGADRPRFGNWWDFQIGSPQRLASTAALIFDQLTADQRARYAAAIKRYVPDDAVAHYTGTSTGANRVDLCRAIIGGALLTDDAARMAVARDAFSPVFPYVITGDGYYADGSFIQHTTVPYIGGYGSVLIAGLGWAFALLSGSEWEIVDPNRELFLATIDTATAPLIFNGLMMDNVSGRGISRSGSSEFGRGTPVLGAIAVIADGVDAERAARWRSMIKGWLDRNDVAPPLTDPRQPLVRLSNLKSIMDDAAITPAPEPVEHRVFGSMDRVTHRRPGWAAAISMSSRRISYYEVGNGENLRGYHTGSGWLQWWTDATIGQFSDAFWPTVDPYRLAGTTTSLKPLPDGAGGNWGAAKPDTAWAGGCTDGEFGVAGQEVRGLESTMRARKSWFSLDEGIVCLGAGIEAGDGHEVDSVIENRQVDDDAGLVVDGERLALSDGVPARLRRPRWAHLDGHAGYVFPAPVRVTALDQRRTGRWRDINNGGPTDAITRRYLALYVDHGVDPAGADYAYLILPGATAKRTAELAGPAQRGRIKIMANSAAAQGIEVAHLGLTAANFWAAARVGSLASSGPASVMVRGGDDRTALICVSDPTRSGTGLTITWDRPVAAVIDQPETVTKISTGGRLVIEFASLADRAGGTQRIRVRLP
ncbi:polysaccharide lyase 8 family protein [Microlunatus parietis]|uniref:Hyaluronate lyase n=1 Tax=Microlunatus parietis TaxID=682979 RepID=A0A7Y9I251_9ACTN|nr:polysaccharide lyase 8 family protein [Microlunatus parietis]NYE68727.1 hyaluronate lyase [Microlunatus parietis]